MSLIRKLAPREVLRTCKNALMDFQFGGFSGGYIRNPNPGSHGTGATDYSIMPQLFLGRIRPEDVLVDVGCGKGRVINWWLSQHLKNRMFGLEQLPNVGYSTRRRFHRFENVTILVGDAIDNLPEKGTLFYLFNPFDEKGIKRLADRLRSHPEAARITVIYFAPVHIDVFQADPFWKVKEIGIRIPSTGHFEDRHKRFAVITRAN